MGINVYAVNAIALVDLDDDNDLDLCIGHTSTLGVLHYSENVGTATVPVFDSLQEYNQFGNPSAYLDFHPALADLDADGDFDMLAGAYGGGLRYFENTGSGGQPFFAQGVGNPFGLKNGKYKAAPSFGDLDGDGDFDLIVGDTTEGFNYYQNIGSDTLPQFAKKINNPFGLVDLNVWAKPCFVDLDGDGDLDVLASDVGPNLYFFENLAIQNTSAVREWNQSDIELYPNPAGDIINIVSGADITQVQILDMRGICLKSTSAFKQGMNVAGLSSGVYFLKITTSDGMVQLKRFVRI